jgi:hypothetical protein
MLVSRRKRKESKVIKVYLYRNRLEKATTLKYLGIILDHKFRFKSHINYATDRCTKVIRNISKSTKLSWRISREAMKTNTKELSYLFYYIHLLSG